MGACYAAAEYAYHKTRGKNTCDVNCLIDNLTVLSIITIPKKIYNFLCKSIIKRCKNFMLLKLKINL
jgi:hypothetical protein